MTFGRSKRKGLQSAREKKKIHAHKGYITQISTWSLFRRFYTKNISKTGIYLARKKLLKTPQIKSNYKDIYIYISCGEPLNDASHSPCTYMTTFNDDKSLDSFSSSNPTKKKIKIKITSHFQVLRGYANGVSFFIL